MIEAHIWIALLVIAAIVAQDTTAGPQILFSEPLVTGPVVGWLLGDLRLGLVIGIAVQLVWSGAVPAGSSLFLDVNVGSLCAVLVATAAGGTFLAMAASLLWMVPVGLLGTALTVVNWRLNGKLAASIRPELDRGRLIGIRHMAGWLLAGLRGIVTFSVGSVLGLALVPALVHRLGPHVNQVLLWAGVCGAGAGVALGVTWRYGRGKVALLGALCALGLWLLGTRPGW